MEPDKTYKPSPRRPEVFRKINRENLLVIERGLLGDLPDKLKPQPQIPYRARPTDLPLKAANVDPPQAFPDSPDLEKPTPVEEDPSPLKKSFSFRDKFSRLSFFGKDKHPDKVKWKQIDGYDAHDEPDRRANTTENKQRTKEKDQDNNKIKRFFLFKGKDDKKEQKKPMYKRSKSFEFLPRAIDESESQKPSNRKLTRNRHSFIHSSTDTLNEEYDDFSFLENKDDSVFADDKNIQVGHNKEHNAVSASNSSGGGGGGSSLSTVNTSATSSVHIVNPLTAPSFIDLCHEFDKTVELFNENYLSDCESYTRESKVKVGVKEKRKSSSFSSLPSPKVVQLNTLKVSEVSEDFKAELSRVISEKRASDVTNFVGSGRTARRGSVTDWFVLDESSVSDKNNKYRRAQKKPVNRVRRISSTKYWITPEECAVYSHEQRPPLVIPRITQYRPPRYDRKPVHNAAHSYPEETHQDAPASIRSGRQYERHHDWSPSSERGRGDTERGFGKVGESPSFGKINKRLGGSSENLLLSNVRRPVHLNIAASSSGDSLDVEIREREPRYRKTVSMVAPKPHGRSPVPVPVPRTFVEAAVVHEGAVKRTKFAESGKKCKKNWIDCYVVLTTTALVFYKDQKTYYATKISKPPGTPPSPNAPRMELVLPLRNAHAVPCIPMHTRRHNRSINLTVDYDAYLLQDETEDGARHWLNLIQSIIYKLGPPTSEHLHYQSSNTDLESLGRTPPVSRHHARVKQKAGGSSNEDLSDTTESIQKSHVRSILRKFFPKRPAMEVLVKKGIYKDEPVFGRNLEEVCPATSPRVPEFVVACVREIEKCEDNMSTDGLYRASGNLSQVQKIRLEIDQNNLSVIENYPDIHVLTGSLKLFFRELKEPLIPCKLFDRILSACSKKPREAKIKEFKDIVHALPQCNRETLKYLLEHLLRVTTYSERNRMHTANLAIVFGPTLLWAPAEQAHNIAIDCIQQNNVVDILLTDFKDIFPEENTRGKKKS